MFLESFSKRSWGFLNVLIITVHLKYLYLYITSRFLVIESLAFGATRKFLMVWLPLKHNWTPRFPQIFLKLSLRSWMCRMTMCVFLLLQPDVTLFCWLSLFCCYYSCSQEMAGDLDFFPVQGPCLGIYIFVITPVDVFVPEVIAVWAYCFDFVEKSADYTMFSWYSVVAVPLKI